ncbi:MAG: FHA domain-containing protein [Lachnospiraceae bacterium]|nr:FHA domain-containing protein [Lachnospiraceae bacterium]
MNIEYRRTVQGSYMVLEGKRAALGFEKQMLKRNDIPQLLTFHSLELNGKTQFWYDIGGMRSFRDIILCEGITADLLYELFSSVKEAYGKLAKYLIEDEHILLHPDALLYEKREDTYRAMLCFCPLEHDDVKEQLAQLMRFVISEVDHSKAEVTALCYELYAITEREEFSFYDLMERLGRECKDSDLSEDFSYDESDFMDTPDYDKPVAAEACRYDRLRYEVPEEPEERVSEKKSLIKKLTDGFKARIIELLPDFLKGRRKLLPEKKPFRDIEFDEVPQPEEETMLLSEDRTGCRGRLIYESGGRGGCDLQVDKNPFSIGSRSGGNDAILSSEAVSRYHAKIFRRDGSFYVQDLNSKNGTFVNGEILPYHKAKKLKRMDVISFADVVYRIV